MQQENQGEVNALNESSFILILTSTFFLTILFSVDTNNHKNGYFYKWVIGPPFSLCLELKADEKKILNPSEWFANNKKVLI